MSKLILSLDGQVLKEIPLTKERTTIGRKPHNDIHIDNRAVSGDHAVIVSVVQDHFLEDLGSTNGTLINGAPVRRHLLKDNDLIELGRYKLVFRRRERAPAHESADYERRVWRPADAKQILEKARASAAQQSLGGADSPAPTPPTPPVEVAPVHVAAPAAGTPLRGVIRYLAGASAGTELELVRPVTTLGKPGFPVAELAHLPQGYFISAVHGANPPQVNGRAIGTAPQALKDHDIIEYPGGNVEFLLRRPRS
jgi:pSer/pThr/pTyr-binding forkhead associated (FHA) protein